MLRLIWIWWLGIAGLIPFASLLFGGEPIHLTILYTNDVHARLLPDNEGRGGWAHIAAYFKSVKKEVEARGGGIFILDGGDMIQGTVVSSVFLGEPIFEVMNAAGYDAAVLGNHEFDLGLGQTAEFLRIAEFPLLAANVREKGQLVADAETLILKTGDLKIGLIGLATSQWVFEETLDFEPPASAVARHWERLQKETGLVIALSHLGLDRDRELASETEGLDLILGGHTHTFMDAAEKIAETVIVQAGAFGHYVGRLDLVLNSEKTGIKDYRWTLVPIPVEGLPPDPETQKVVDYWEGKVAAEMNVVIGETRRFLHRDKELRAMVARIWQKTYQTDFGWQNPGANMQDLSVGPIAVRDFYEILPWGNTLVILEMDRAQVQEILAEVVIEKEKSTCTLITNSFAARELMERFKLPEERAKRIPVQARDPIIAYVRKNGKLPIPEQ